MENIYLTGMRGSGKTTIARLLAETLGKTFVDMDHLIREKEQRSVVEIVDQEGWDYFREQERDLVRELSGKTDHVVGTGGGVLMYFDNADRLRESGLLVLLEAEAAVLAERIEKESDRPSITGADFISEINTVWNERKETYRTSAEAIIDTNNKSPEKIVQEILAELSVENDK